MKCLTISLLAIAFASAALAQQQTNPIPAGAGATAPSDGPNLSVARLGKDDLIGISVYDAPELTRTVRVDDDGNIRLPMVQQHIKAAGLLPVELENSITTALVDEHVLVSPVVTVSVVEYHSRPITVVGAVKNPTTFQATGNVTLLEAITRAGGLTENAGAEIEVGHLASSANGKSVDLTERIPVHSLMNEADPAANMKLEGGETIRVPQAGQVFVVGNVKHPGPFLITNDSESSVLKALAIAGGLDSFSSNTAYIYRIDDSSGRKNEIPIPIKKILSRKSPDVPIYGNDMLYVPSANGQRVSAKALGMVTGIGLGIAFLLVYAL
ncbi:MAG TPA: polysaccharide biosynthesis/export family protein [Terracidiphilus sp.]|nr:polysaccharide biosynthesis/export family protein [Terracidiphilus sp.]